ncbi:type II toxin-antitoxin system Phd/YefM family antitoxin [Dehalobacterium formicoaceticum]|uniref:Antitoxin n=2 Tax=Dehalobacterium formicoaceticum TaxID=51515 RepID=A0ABT1Y8U1_9FIRM|nr:type II toxin-antitoxin system Phd/YefM family antitoxin [Dehalobacterium formicoaceticum]MCR6546071.1 type II toxin-antitoxin system Phd/YefM family antitoxin [Dehalobacterium formicoaceticum]
MTIINATTARNNFFKLIEEALTTHEPVYITSKTGNVVVLSEEDYRSIQETLYLCSVPTMREKIMEGLNTPLDECIEDDLEDTAGE